MGSQCDTTKRHAIGCPTFSYPATPPRGPPGKLTRGRERARDSLTSSRASMQRLFTPFHFFSCNAIGLILNFAKV